MSTKTPLAYSVAQAAEVTGLSASHIKRLIDEGLLKAKATSLRSDGHPAKRVILAAELQRYLDGLVDA
jgi:excisionase family DNA binding protein